MRLNAHMDLRPVNATFGFQYVWRILIGVGRICRTISLGNGLQSAGNDERRRE